MKYYKYVSEAVQLVSKSWYEIQTFSVNLHSCKINFVLSTSLAECWFRQDLCPLSVVLICQARLGKEVVFTRLMDPFGLFPLSCSFGWDMPLKVMSLPSQVLRGEKCVWENGNMLWNVLFSSPPHPTTSHFLLLGKSSWQVFSSHCQLC